MMGIKWLGAITGGWSLLVFVCCGQAEAQPSQSKTITFCGYDWVVRPAGKGGPGPNQWSPDNVWLDKAGRLHLKMRQVVVPATATQPEHKEWQCAELYTRKSLGFGVYQFEVMGRIDRFNRNVVLGLFDYPEDAPDGTNEIDIEFARWGNDRWPNGSYTIYPSFGERDMEASHAFHFTLPDQPDPVVTVHRFTRDPQRIEFQSIMQPGAGKSKEIAKWLYKGFSRQRIPQKQLPVHINLWLFRGEAPSDGREVEVVIQKFSFTPVSL